MNHDRRPNILQSNVEHRRSHDPSGQELPKVYCQTKIAQAQQQLLLRTGGDNTGGDGGGGGGGGDFQKKRT